MERHIASGAEVIAVRSTAIEPGLSGAAIQRHRLVLRRPDGRLGRARLVTKAASLVERRVLTRLAEQGIAGIPFSHAPDTETDAPRLVCLQDLGTRHRPTSRDPIDLALIRREAASLAAIHHANLGQADALQWLPRADRAYFTRQIEQICFRPAWERAMADPAFVATFGRTIGLVEAAAARIVDEMADLAAETAMATLVHTDLNPGNVLIHRSRPWIIDWQAAHYGSLFLDLPHHLHTLALAGLGHLIPATVFAERYRVAARYTALRYLWWTLAAWREDRAATPWVQHYLTMIDGGDH